MAVFHKGQVEAAEVPADVGEVAAVGRIAAEIKPLPAAFDSPARPQHTVVVGQVARAVVAGGSGGECYAADGMALIPIRRRNVFRLHAPAAQQHFHAQRHQEMHPAVCHAAYEGFLQVVVVVVAVEDDVERRQFVRRGGRRLEAAKHFVVRCGAHAEHGVGDDVQPGHTHQQGGMAEPDKPCLLFIFR